MKKRTLKTDKRKIKYSIPSNIHEVTYKQYNDIVQSGFEQKKIIEILTGLEESIWEIDKAVSLYILLQKELNPVLKEMNNDLADDSIKSIEYKGVIYNMDFDIGHKTFAQYRDLQEALVPFSESFDGDKLDMKEFFKVLPHIVAIYLQPLVTEKKDHLTGKNELDTEEVKAIEKDLWEYPCVEIISLANFFLTSMKGSKNGIATTLHTLIMNLKNLPLVFLRLANRLGFTV